MSVETMESLDVPRPRHDVDELSLLLPTWQIEALAEVAENEGLTVAQFMRRLVSKTLALSSAS